MKVSIYDNIDPKFLDTTCKKAEKILAIQVEKDTRPFVPARTMSLNQRTRVQGNAIIYPGPYARYLYYGKVMVDSVTGRGAMKIPVGEGGDYIFRHRKGATLVPTGRDLHFNTGLHPQATSHWLEASKAANERKWMDVARRAIANEYNK